MRTLRRGLAVLLVFGFSAALAAGVVYSASADQVVAALKANGYKKITVSGAAAGSPVISIDLGDGYLAEISFYNDDKRRGGFESLRISAETSVDWQISTDDVNDWNAFNRYAKAYVQNGSDITLASDLDLSGGVVLKSTIGSFMKDFMEAFDAFQSELIGQ